MLHAYAIRHAIANGMTEYDFLRGNEPYKYSFGCEERRIRSLFVTTKDHRNLGGKLDAQKAFPAGPAARVRTASGGPAR